MIDIIDKIISLSANQKIKVGFQAKGRLTDVSRKVFTDKKVMIDVSDNEVMPAVNQDMVFYGLRDDDIPGAVADGTVQFGIVGTNVLMEKYKNNPDIEIIEVIEKDKCRLSFATPKEMGIERLEDLAGKTCITSYPKLAQECFADNDIDVTVLPVEGKVEMQCRELGRGDFICDLVESGNTLKKYDLVEYKDPVMNVDVVLIANKKFRENFMPKTEGGREVDLVAADRFICTYGT